MSKASKDRRDAYYAEQARYVRELAEAVEALMPGFRQLSPPIVDFHHVGPFTSTPDDRVIWFVVPERSAIQAAEAGGLPERLLAETRAELERRGYPASGRATLSVVLTSQEDIDEAGGIFKYFRKATF